MNQLNRICSTLLSDVEAISSAYQNLQDSMRDLQAKYPDERIEIILRVPFAAWVHSKFNGEKEAIYNFLAKSIKDFQGDKSQLWSWGVTPEQTNPDIEAIRLLDRIDIGTAYLAKDLNIKAPYKSIQDGGWEQQQCIMRFLAFAKAANDIIVE